MCGIIGCVSQNNIREKLLVGLHRLEYRGYDSAGVVFLQNGRFHWEKSPGKISELKNLLTPQMGGNLGLGHTRWATHGAPNRPNAHPHFSCDNQIALAHNGIIENYEKLKAKLRARGHIFRSQTDTEVIVHLIEEYTKKYSPWKAVRLAVKELQGSFALGIVFANDSNTLIGVRRNSPLVVGLGEEENFLASDVSALLPYTRKVIFLEENEIVRLKKDKVEIFGFDDKQRRHHVNQIDWDISSAEKGGYDHFMLKEIYEQPEVAKLTIGYYVNEKSRCAEFKSLERLSSKLKKIKRVVITACGTAWHASLVSKYALEELVHIPVEVAIASELRYSNPIFDRTTLLIAISQSGETADTLAALRAARAGQAFTLAICNVVGSSLTREADSTIYTYAGPEISVASTKAYTCQLLTTLLFAIYLGRLRGTLSRRAEQQLISELLTIPRKISKVLDQNETISQCAERYRNAPNFMYIARRYNFPNAYEGALKMKEISYTHAEGYGAGEMKHGPLALVDNTFPTVAIAVKSKVYEKMLSNIQEIKARQGILIVIATEGDQYIKSIADDVIYVPKTEEIFSPILTVVPLQLLAYQTAVKKGREIDQPRNLAKSVTVE